MLLLRQGLPEGHPHPAVLRRDEPLSRLQRSGRGEIRRDARGEIGAKASECIACGACETVCPQKIQIIDELKRVVTTLE